MYANSTFVKWPLRAEIWQGGDQFSRAKPGQTRCAQARRGARKPGAGASPDPAPRVLFSVKNRRFPRARWQIFHARARVGQFPACDGPRQLASPNRPVPPQGGGGAPPFSSGSVATATTSATPAPPPSTAASARASAGPESGSPARNSTTRASLAVAVA